MTTKTPTYRTPAEVLDLWIAALRSGKYRQGYSYLRKGSKFCCLGVLCDLAREDGGRPWGFDDNTRTHMYAGRADMPPYYLVDHVGISKDEAKRLAHMNDALGASFEDIADHIEAHRDEYLAQAC